MVSEMKNLTVEEIWTVTVYWYWDASQPSDAIVTSRIFYYISLATTTRGRIPSYIQWGVQESFNAKRLRSQWIQGLRWLAMVCHFEPESDQNFPLDSKTFSGISLKTNLPWILQHLGKHRLVVCFSNHQPRLIIASLFSCLNKRGQRWWNSNLMKMLLHFLWNVDFLKIIKKDATTKINGWKTIRPLFWGKRPFWSGFAASFRECTSPTTNMDTQNDGLEKVATVPQRWQHHYAWLGMLKASHCMEGKVLGDSSWISTTATTIPRS